MHIHEVCSVGANYYNSVSMVNRKRRGAPRPLRVAYLLIGYSESPYKLTAPRYTI